MLKFILYLIIIFGCGYIGICHSAKFKRRVTQLEEFQKILKRLEFNICFMNIPLSEAFEKTAKNQSEEFEMIIRCVSDELKNKNYKSLEDIWKKAFEENSEKIYLNPDDIEIIIDFAKSLGKGDVENEKNNIDTTLARLELKYKEALKISANSMKLHRSIGLAAGVFIVIILI